MVVGIKNLTMIGILFIVGYLDIKPRKGLRYAGLPIRTGEV